MYVGGLYLDHQIPDREDKESMTSQKEFNLFDEKGSCQICSTSTVQRRVDKADFHGHALEHKRVGDPVEIDKQADAFTVRSAQ